jgi:hypothetical protein
MGQPRPSNPLRGCKLALFVAESAVIFRNDKLMNGGLS